MHAPMESTESIGEKFVVREAVGSSAASGVRGRSCRDIAVASARVTSAGLLGAEGAILPGLAATWPGAPTTSPLSGGTPDAGVAIPRSWRIEIDLARVCLRRWYLQQRAVERGAC